MCVCVCVCVRACVRARARMHMHTQMYRQLCISVYIQTFSCHCITARILQATATVWLYQSDLQRVQQADLKKFEGPSDVVTSGATEELKEKLVVRQQYVMVIPNA